MRILIGFALLLTSCSNRSNQTWEDVKTTARYINRGFNSLLGKDFDSRLLTTNDEFNGPNSEDFIPMSDADISKCFSDSPIPQPKRFPGEKGSNLPGIDQFYEPGAELSTVFKHLHFEVDHHVLKEKEDLLAITKMAERLKNNPNLYVIVEGHCDERASADYNMALGMRRAQYVRGLLCKQGINPNRVYTISCGKEKPISLGHNTEDWYKNRRAQFKVYEKR